MELSDEQAIKELAAKAHQARTYYELLGYTNVANMTAAEREQNASSYALARAKWQEAEGDLEGAIQKLRAKARAAALA